MSSTPEPRSGSTTPTPQNTSKPSDSCIIQNVIDLLNLACTESSKGIIMKQLPFCDMGHAAFYDSFDWTAEEIKTFKENGTLPRDEDTMIPTETVRPIWIFSYSDPVDDPVHDDVSLDVAPNLQQTMVQTPPKPPKPVRGLCIFVKTKKGGTAVPEWPLWYVVKTGGLRYTPRDVGKGRFDYTVPIPEHAGVKMKGHGIRNLVILLNVSDRS